MTIVITIVSVALLCACQSSRSPNPRPQFEPVEPFATTPSSTTTIAALTAAPQWTARSFTAANSDGTTRTCVEISTATTVATTCITSPGVFSWTVADAHFVVALGDIALTDGSVIRADTAGIAVGFLPSDAIPTTDVRNACGRHDLAPAVAEHYPDSTVAWLPARCEGGGGVASVTALLADRTEVIALMEKTNDGEWLVFATFRAPVKCKLLDVSSRNKCKLLRYDD